MAFLTREQLLAAQNRPTVTVSAPEIGGDLRVRIPSAAAVERIKDLGKKVDAGEASESDAARFLLSEALVDEGGTPLFPSPEDAAAIHEAIPPEVLARVSRAFLGSLRRLEKPGEAAPKPETPEEGKGEPSSSGT